MSEYNFFLQNGRDFIVVNGELSTYPDITLSETNTFEFYIKDNGLSVDLEGGGSSGGSYSGTTGFTYSGGTGATYAGLGQTVSDDAKASYNRLKEYQTYAGYANTSATLGGSTFSENPDAFDRAPIDGIVIGIEPGDDVTEARGVWGVIESITDDTEIFGAIARVSVDLFVLAGFDEYGSEEQVRDAFEADF